MVKDQKAENRRQSLLKDRTEEYRRRQEQRKEAAAAKRSCSSSNQLKRPAAAARGRSRSRSGSPAAPARSRSRSHSGSPWADRLVADTNPFDAVQFFKKLSKEKRHVVSRLSTSILVKYFEFLRVDTTSMSRSELIEELLMQIDRAPLL